MSPRCRARRHGIDARDIMTGRDQRRRDMAAKQAT
jgi:hypothetical protein